MSEGPKKHRNRRVTDPNQPRRPTTSFNFFMKHKSTEYINKHVGVSLCDVIKIMSKDWHTFSAEEKKPYDDASSESKKEYDKKMEEYQKTDDYRKFLKMKEDIKDGKINASDVPKNSRTAKKTNSTLKASKKTLAAKKLPFEIFTKEFKDFNRQREDDYRKLKKQVFDLEDEIENAEERLEALNGQKMKIKAEQNDSITIERQCKKTMEKYRQTILSSSHLKGLLHLSSDSSVADVVNALKEAQKKSSINEQIKKHITELKFN